jgi:hypothetical protein
MKKALKILGIILALMVLTPLVGMLFLSSKYTVKRSAMVNAEASRIYPRIATLKEWDKWSAWGKASDTNAIFTYEGPESGTGAVWKWDGPRLGNGEMKMLKCVPNESVEYQIGFEHNAFRGHGVITLEKEGAGTRINWVGDGDFGSNPFYKLAGLFMDKMLGGNFETGMNNLKVEAEKK